MEKIKNIPQGKVKRNIKGAPYKIGNLVKVIFATDETFDNSFMGQVGKIIHYCYSCGCGQSFPDDPMIGIEFNEGVIEEFWKEEIKRLK